MGELEVYTTVRNRDTLGRFLAELPIKARRAIEETAKGGAAVARAEAPVKTGALKASIQPVIFSDWSGGVTVGTDHWKYTNYGASAHDIKGDVHFWWEREGRPWFPGSNTIRHPGITAVHYMDHAADYCKHTFMEAVRRNFG